MNTPIYTGLLQSDFNAAGYKVTGLQTPTAANDAATKAYVDAHPGGGGGVLTQNIFYPEDYGALGDGTTDDTTAMQDCVTAAVAVNGTVKLSPVTYKVTTALSVTGSVAIEGSGMFPQNGTIASLQSINMPLASPFIKGSVILQTGAGQNGITISATGRGVNLRDFGIRFADAIKFANTGHGVFSEGAAYAGKKDSGIMSSLWSNIGVYGHDGNHYAFHFTNPICSTFNHLTGWGGGGIQITSDQAQSYYGNSVFEHPYFATCVAGSAHGYHVTATPGSNQVYFLTFVRPQVNVASTGVATAPTNAQYTFNIEGNAALYVNIFAPDFETDCGSTTAGIYGWGSSNITGGFVDGIAAHYGEWSTDQSINGSLSVVTAVYIGSDARLVSITGGVKLEVRNAGTGVWVEATRYTNP